MSQRPNLIFIMPDQLRHDFLSCYGGKVVETPHIDSLAQSGLRFERAYSTSPVCVPARASLLTGMNAIRNGVTDNGQWLRPDLNEMGIRCWPELLAEAGYYTAAIGKMHFYPWDITHGFQHRVACEDKRWLHVRDEYFRFLRERGLRKLHGNEHENYHEQKGATVSPIPYEDSWDGFVGAESCRFLREYGHEEPFAMMIGFPGPHCPYDPTQEYLDQIDPENIPEPIPASGVAPALRRHNVEGNQGAWNGVDYSEFTVEQQRRIRRHYAALVKQIDDQIGALLATLDETGLRENTVIIFASDHGDYLGDHDLIGKGTFYESSIHVPMILNGPGIPSAEVNTELVTLGDVTASLLYLGGVILPAYLDSRPLPGIGAERAERTELLGMVSNGWMLYDGRWKLCKYKSGDVLLFDLESDPQERVDQLEEGGREVWDQYRQMDGRLTAQVQDALCRSHDDKRVYAELSLSSDPGFGKRGWRRPYPQHVSAFGAGE